MQGMPMSDHVHEGDFFEEDEPLEEIVGAWTQGFGEGLTSDPSSGLVQHTPVGGPDRIVPLFVPPAANYPSPRTAATPRTEDDARLPEFSNA